MRLPRPVFIPEVRVSRRRRGLAAVLTIAVVMVNSWGDFIGDELNVPGLTSLISISVTVALLSTVAFSTVTARRRPGNRGIRRNPTLLRSSRRAIAQLRQAPMLSTFRAAGISGLLLVAPVGRPPCGGPPGWT